MTKESNFVTKVLCFAEEIITGFSMTSPTTNALPRERSMPRVVFDDSLVGLLPMCA